MNSSAQGWDLLVLLFAHSFTQPSFNLFSNLLAGWILCPGRHTVTRIIRVIDAEGEHAHDAYHRFLRVGAWSMATLWKTAAQTIVSALNLSEKLDLDLDDTLFHKSGKKVNGAGNFRDAVRSCGKRVVYALGLNLVILTLRVRPPWGGEPLGLPINVRLYGKGGPSHLELGEEMIKEVAEWFPDHRFVLSCDGAYASMAGKTLPRTHLVSRMRRDAALYELPPKRKKRGRGRPRKKGKRLPSPPELARRRKKGWVRAKIDERGKLVDRLLLAIPVLWYAVCPDRQVLLVIVRDPEGKQEDDFFFTTDLPAGKADFGAVGTQVASQYAGRWSIEDTNRNIKQFLGGEDPQSWKGEGPERAAALSCWIYSAVWLWYLTTHGTKITWPSLPWYPAKTRPSFADALAALRRVLWRRRISSASELGPHPAKIFAALIEVLATAA